MYGQALGSHARTRIVRQISRSRIDRLGTNQAAIAKLFETVRRPAKHSAHGECRREQIRRQPDTVQQQRRVELDVRVESPIGLPFAQEPKRRRLDVTRELVPVSYTHLRA